MKGKTQTARLIVGVPARLASAGIPTRRIAVMRYLAVVLFIVINPFPCCAQYSEQYRACEEKAKTQTQMHACANEEATGADAELNDVYRKVMSKAASQPEAVSKIESAERAWITYRDAYMEAMYPAK